MRNAMKPILRYCLFVIVCMFWAPFVRAQAPVPSQITIVVPFGVGASNDSIARVIAPLLAERLNTNVIVENRAGAAGTMGASMVARSVPDGATLLLTSSTFATAAATQARLPYDPVKGFVPVAMVGQGPLVIAASGTDTYRSLSEVIQAAREKPGQLNYGSSGIGSLAHLATLLMAKNAQIELVHVPYKGAAAAASDLAGGRIQLMLANYSSLAPLLEGGKVRLIATTAPGPHDAFPALTPAITDVPSFSTDIWVGVFAPAGTPHDLITRYNLALNEINKSSRLTELLKLDGTVPANLSPEAFAQRVASDIDQWKKLATQYHIEVN